MARIDGNSIGWILNPVRFEGSEANFSDGIRRRSMRFNAHWWRSLSYALERVNEEEPDRVSCWVSAGDDIIIAEYGRRDRKSFQTESSGLSWRLWSLWTRELIESWLRIPKAPSLCFSWNFT